LATVFVGGNPPFQPKASVSFGSVDNPGGIGANSVQGKENLLNGEIPR